MITAQEIYISESSIESLNAAVSELQAHYVTQSGAAYSAADVQKVLTVWLEGAIEQLCEDVLFHTVEGSPAFAFNRAGFESQLAKVQPIEPTAPAVEVSVAA